MRLLRALLLPSGTLVVLGAAAALFAPDSTLALVTGQYAVVLYAVGAVLAGAFHRSRVVATLVALGGIDFMGRHVQGPEGLGGAGASAADPFPVLLTGSMGLVALLAVSRDRGILARVGLLQVGMGGVMAGAAYLAYRDPTWVGGFDAVRLVPWTPPEWLDVPQPTLTVAALAALAVVYGLVRWRGPVEGALGWTLALLVAATLPEVGRPQASWLVMVAGLVLSISVLETSYSMAFRDELTGLPARRALMQALAEIGGTYTVAMVDVDHFKRFNDRHGHDVGDQVLKLVAKHLAAGPGGGKAFRYGGEEFTILYPGRVAADARPCADEVRRSVESATFSLRAWNRPRRKPEKKSAKRGKRARKLSVTVSIGLADSSAGEGDPAAVLERADEALYRAKSRGRNRVAI